VGSIHGLKRRSGSELAAEDRDQPLVGIRQTVFREVTAFKSHVDLEGFSWGWFASSHDILLDDPVAIAQLQYQTVRARREIPVRSQRVTARAGW
jgi:hypothetical protein